MGLIGGYVIKAGQGTSGMVTFGQGHKGSEGAGHSSGQRDSRCKALCSLYAAGRVVKETDTVLVHALGTFILQIR